MQSAWRLWDIGGWGCVGPAAAAPVPLLDITSAHQSPGSRHQAAVADAGQTASSQRPSSNGTTSGALFWTVAVT